MASLLTQIKVRKDTYENIKNLVLTQGEPGFAHDTGDYAVGNGTNKFSDICFKLQKGVINNGASTDNAIARFDGTTGRVIQNSSVTIDDSGNIVLPRDAYLKLNTYGTRFLTLTGNSITADMSQETGGWAGTFAAVKAPGGATTTMLGWYGSATGLNYIFMGGTYSDPSLKMTGAGDFTIKKPLTISETTNAPLIINSTALVSNLNADLLDSKHASDFAFAKEGIYYVEGSGTTAGQWLGSNDRIIEYYDGLTVLYKINVAGHKDGVTLNINGKGAKTVYRYGTTKVTTHYPVNSVIVLSYMADINSGCWMVLGDYDSNSNTVPSAYCETAAGTAAKVASCTNYTLTANTYLHVLMRYANSYAGAITLNVNSKGAKPIYINGTASSSSNYTLPAGTYIAYYDGTAYQFRTDGKLPASISGDADTVDGKHASDFATSGHTHTTTIATSTDTSEITLTHGGKYAITAGGDSFIFTMPTDSNTDTKVTQTVTTASNTSKRPMLLGYSYSDAATPSFSTVTNTAYASHNIYVAPKDGFLYANKFIGTSTSVSWYQGRDSAAFRDTGSAGYHAALSLKTTNGSWEFGTYNSDNYYDVPLLTYITDANYNSKNNTTTYQIKFPLKSGTIALTSDLSSFVAGPTSATDNAIARYDGTTGKLIQNSGVTIDDSGNVVPTTTAASELGSSTIAWKRAYIHQLDLYREKGNNYGRISFYKPTMYTWFEYMSPSGVASPTGANTIQYGEVTSWARRSLIEPNSGYGWIWEAASNSANAALVGKMALSSTTGNLKVAGSVTANGFKHSDTTTGTNDYVLLAGGGTKAVGDFATSSHYHTFTASGVVSQPTFTGTKTTLTIKITPAGTVSQPTFTGNEMTSSGSYTPEGTVSAPTITVTPNTTTINSITAVGSLPAWNSSYDETTQHVTVSWSAGTLPTKGSNTTVVTGIKSATSSQPSFTGTAGTISVTGTPGGTVSQPTFQGSEGSGSMEYTPAGTVSQPTFTGTANQQTSTAVS